VRSGGSGHGAGWAIFWVLFVIAILGVAGFIFYEKKGKKGKSQVCLLCYFRCLSNQLPGHRFVNKVKAAEESGSDYQDGLMEKKSGGFFSKFHLMGNK
jgi:hypothetical protein